MTSLPGGKLKTSAILRSTYSNTHSQINQWISGRKRTADSQASRSVYISAASFLNAQNRPGLGRLIVHQWAFASENVPVRYDGHSSWPLIHDAR